MYENDAKDMLKAILKYATANAQNKGVSIDFERQFVLIAKPDWTLAFIDRVGTKINYDNLICCMNASHDKISIPYSDNRLARMPHKVLYMNRYDEYDYLIPSDVYKTILEKICVPGGMHVHVDNPERNEMQAKVNAIQDKILKKIQEYRNEHANEIVTSTPFYANLIAKHRAEIAPFLPFLKHIDIEIIPPNVTSIDALNIWFDMNVV